MAAVVKESRFAVRSLARQPLAAAIILLTLALGLGTNAATFGMTDRLLLRPFQIPNVDRLLMVAEGSATMISPQETVAPANFVEWRAGSSALRSMSAFVYWDVNLSGGDRPERVQGFQVTADFFTALGVGPALGRTLDASDEVWGRHHQVVISDSLWHRRFGGDAGIVGRTIRLDGETRTIVGVAPRGFDFPFGTEVWAPLALNPEAAQNRVAHYLSVIAALPPEVDIDQARAEMATIYARQKAAHPDATRGRQMVVTRFTDGMVDAGLPTVLALWHAAAAVLLLIGCTNIAGLLIARGAERRNEIAVRLALGASRGQLVRQLLVESFVLAALAVPLALGAAFVVLRVIKASMPAALVRFVSGWNEMGIDARVVLFTIAAATLTAVVFGLVPAMSASRAAPNATLRDGGRSSTAGPARHRLRRGLVIGQVALALPLLVASGLAALAGYRLVNGPQGYSPDGMFQMRIILPLATYPDAAAQRRFAVRLLEGAREVPGVTAAGISSVLPANTSNQERQITIDGVPDNPDTPRVVNYRAVSAGYLETMQVPLRAGRSFTAADREGRERVSIVTESLARAYFREGSALGRRIRIGTNDENWTTVVGISGDTLDDWFFARREPTIYVPFDQFPDSLVSLVARTSAAPADLAGGLGRALSAVDPMQPAFATMTFREALRQRTTGLRFIAGFMAAIGALSLVLAAVGVYGVMAAFVAERRHELGVRIALGASSRDVLALTVGQSLRLASIGIALGLAAAVALARVIESALFGIVALEISLFAAVAALLAVVALAATVQPARRAMKLDPTVALRG
jgi:putative ABC transport system permease protein